MARAASLLARVIAGCCLLLLVDAGAARQLVSVSPDADALLKFKAGLENDDKALRSWAQGTSPCDGARSNWAGVKCDADGVLGLNLEKMGLAGKLDLQPLKTLRSLRTVSVMNNQFAGPFPDVKALHGLRAVFLSGNKFSGEIPADAFDGMGSLKKVYLTGNAFSGPIPASLANAPRLVDVALSNNKFQGTIPEFRSKDLKFVNVSNNELEGEIPASLKSMKPENFAGNKKLCGGSTSVKCEAPSSPPPTAGDKIGTPSEPAQTTDQPSSDQNAQKPTHISTSSGVLFAFLGAMAIAGVAFVVLQRRREYKTKNFGPSMSRKPSMMKIDPLHPAKDGGAAAGGADERSHRAGGGAAKKSGEQGRLTFVRDDRGRFFELQDLLKATAEVLGKANLGVCYRATLTSGHSVVVKRFKEMNRVGKEDFEEHMRRLGRLSHPNLLPLIAYYYRKEEKLLMHDFVPNKSLAHLLHGTHAAGESRGGMKKAAVHWTTRLKIVKGVARALYYMYDELPMLTVPHGHLKSSNILLDERFNPLLNDYALVPVMNQSHAAQLMVAFKAPERKQFGRSSKKSDVWCLGLLILEIVTGKLPSYDVKPPAPDADSHHHGGTDLAALVSSTPESQWLKAVVDSDLRLRDEEEQEQAVKLIKIGMACCETNMEARWEIKDAAERIEELKENDSHSFSTADGDEDFANVSIT